MARIKGHSPRGGRGREAPGDDLPTTGLSKRVAQPVSGRRGRFGYYAGFRPRWHRWVGGGLVVAGIAIAVLNDAMWFTDVTLLPFGHREFWLATGVAVSAWGPWFLGLFDPSMSRTRRTAR
jgi:hypothetical protein